MPKPKDWKGSDLRTRAEVAQWLHDHGDEVHDPQGLIVGRIKSELNKGRGLSQLLLDMDQDGMIKREVRGRRTFMIKLVDDWGLLNDLRSTPAPRQAAEPALELDGEVDYEKLAYTLLAVVLKRAQTQPSRGAEVERLKEQVAKLKAERQELRDNLILARESEAEQRRQADSMRESLAKAQAKLAGEADRAQKRGSRGKAKVEDMLDADSRAVLAQLKSTLK